jgi:hypothetical protein
MRLENDDDASNECRVLSKNSNDSTARLAAATGLLPDFDPTRRIFLC